MADGARTVGLSVKSDVDCKKSRISSEMSS